MLRRVLVRLRTRIRLRRERRSGARIDPNFVGFDKYRRTGAYHWKELASNDDYRAKVDFVTGYVKPTHRVLDVGCGDGAYLSVVSQVCAEAVGVDADEHAIREASSMLQAAGHLNVRCFQAPLSQIPALDIGPFDVVYSMDVIEHLPDPGELAMTARELCVPDGTIVIGTPRFLGRQLQSPYHVREFEPAELLALLEPSLEVIDHCFLPEVRQDGRRYDDSFMIAVCRPR